jgi:hypothetical protein
LYEERGRESSELFWYAPLLVEPKRLLELVLLYLERKSPVGLLMPVLLLYALLLYRVRLNVLNRLYPAGFVLGLITMMLG